ncbi:MAG: hypothetical protein KKD29_07095 [Candidatus Omnitrophica bacterium]|nr:hypothetical protein [Candidatus Omnitrophota bacterium]MBU4488587.1 hypothetical protein [Candidatus Omnitrophota bacterium]MCG2704467.1 hypothetical protein [Candidatus Omnitrophota bacterium]
MTKKFLLIWCVVLMVIVLAGCGDIMKKFVRKKDPGKEDYSFYQVEDYKPRPAPERYVKNYILWHNWHAELERTDDTNYTRDVFNLNESLKYLTAMRDLLDEEEAKKLDVQINDMQAVMERMKNRMECVKDNTNNRRIVARVGRVVQDEFSYKRMRKYIKTDE